MRKKKFVPVTLLVILSLIITTFTGCSRLKSYVTDLGEDEKLPTMEDVNAVEIPEEERQYLMRYFNDGYTGLLHYQDLYWNISNQINPKTTANSDNIDVVALGENVYIRYFFIDIHKVYQYNLNTQELTCILDEEDFEPYVYTGSGNFWIARMVKTDSTLVIIGRANGWENILEYDPQNPELGLQYKCKYYPEQEAGYLSLLDTPETPLGQKVKFWNNDNGIYKAIVLTSRPMTSFEFSAVTGTVQNIKTYENTVFDDETDIFYGEENGEMINYYLEEKEWDDPITGKEKRCSVLFKNNMDTQTIEEVCELPYINWQRSPVLDSKLTSKWLLFDAGISDEARGAYGINLDNKKLYRNQRSDFWEIITERDISQDLVTGDSIYE